VLLTSVLRGDDVFVAGAVAGCVRFRRGFCVAIVAMRQKEQQLEGARMRAQELLRAEASRGMRCRRPGCLCAGSAFAMLETFHLLEPLFGFLLGFVGTAEILLAILGKNFVAAGNLLDHQSPLL
jgi:hypothetical protein